MSTDKVLELERERDAWEKLAREEGRAKLDYLYDAAMLQAKVDELQAELAEPCDCGTLRAQLAEANQRAERLIKDRDDWRRRYGMAQEVIKESAGVLPEGAVCFVPDGGKGGKGGKGYPMKGDYYMDLDGSVIKAECNHREVTYPIMVPWHPPKAEPEKPERELYTVPDPEPGDKLEWECEGVTNDGQFWIGLVDGFVTEAVANRAVEILNTHFAEPPKAESGEGDEYAQDPDAGTLASELCRIADSIGRNDCTRSWAEKFIYSIVDELPPAIASHVMRPPITDSAPKAPAASEEPANPKQAAAMAGGPFDAQDNARAADFLKRLRVDRGAIVSSADCSTMEIAFAQKEKRFYVDSDSMGYVMRMKPWREECERLIEARCNARDVSDSPSAPPAAEVGGGKSGGIDAKTWETAAHYWKKNYDELKASQPPVTAKGTQYAPDITEEMKEIVEENGKAVAGMQSEGYPKGSDDYNRENRRGA